MACKGTCNRYKAKKPKNSTRYSAGQKRCQMCEMFILWDGRNCPCCSHRLRTRPRSQIYKTRFRTDRNVKYIA